MIKLSGATRDGGGIFLHSPWFIMRDDYTESVILRGSECGGHMVMCCLLTLIKDCKYYVFFVGSDNYPNCILPRSCFFVFF